MKVLKALPNFARR